MLRLLIVYVFVTPVMRLMRCLDDAEVTECLVATILQQDEHNVPLLSSWVLYPLDACVLLAAYFVMSNIILLAVSPLASRLGHPEVSLWHTFLLRATPLFTGFPVLMKTMGDVQDRPRSIQSSLSFLILTKQSFAIDFFNRLHGIADDRIHSFDDYLKSKWSAKWSCVINFADVQGKQVSKLLAGAGKTTSLHGLWYDSAHNPGPLTFKDLQDLHAACSEFEFNLPALFPMFAQKLPREYARHAAAFMDASVYIRAIATSCLRSEDVFLTYGCLRFWFTLTPDDEDEEDEDLQTEYGAGMPVYIVNELGFGQGWDFPKFAGFRQEHLGGRAILVFVPTPEVAARLSLRELRNGPVSWITSFEPTRSGSAMTVDVPSLCASKVPSYLVGHPAVWFNNVPPTIWWDSVKTKTAETQAIFGGEMQSLFNTVGCYKAQIADLEEDDLIRGRISEEALNKAKTMDELRLVLLHPSMTEEIPGFSPLELRNSTTPRKPDGHCRLPACGYRPGKGVQGDT